LITTVPVLHENAYLVLEDVVVNDSNGNNIVEPGETVELGIKLQNLGLNTAAQVQLTATENSDYASLSIANSVYSDIVGDATEINHTPITLDVDLFTPDATVIPIVCSVSIAGNSWQFPISLTVHKPAIQISGTFMNDTMARKRPHRSGNHELIINVPEWQHLVANNVTSNIIVFEHLVSPTLSTA
jgi:uncharacterized repeat protein (TIGR01451 family)